MYNNLSLIRALQFPRASLPLAYVIVELQQLMLSMVVMVGDRAGLCHEPLTWYWFLAIPVLLLQTLFNLGAGLIIARIGAELNDVSQLVPFLTRVWRYFCGVMYSIATLPATLPLWAKEILQLNPAAVYISLMRLAIMETQRTNAPGAEPYNALKCAAFHAQTVIYSDPGLLSPGSDHEPALGGAVAPGRCSRCGSASCTSGAPRRASAAADPSGAAAGLCGAAADPSGAKRERGWRTSGRRRRAR